MSAAACSRCNVVLHASSAVRTPSRTALYRRSIPCRLHGMVLRGGQLPPHWQAGSSRLRLATSAADEEAAAVGDDAAETGFAFEEEWEEDKYGSEEEADSDDEEELWDEEAEPVFGPPALVIAGWPNPQYLARLRVLIDSLGGQGLPVIPSTPELLLGPVAAAIQQPEPAWDQPLGEYYLEGGGWGQVRVALFSGLPLVEQAVILQAMEDEGLGPAWGATATPANAGMQLGAALAEALQKQRSSRSGSSQVQQQFVGDLPELSLEQVVVAQQQAAVQQVQAREPARQDSSGREAAAPAQQQEQAEAEAAQAETEAEAAVQEQSESRHAAASAAPQFSSDALDAATLGDGLDIIDRLAQLASSAADRISEEQQQAQQPSGPSSSSVPASAAPAAQHGGTSAPPPASADDGSSSSSSGTRKPWELGSASSSGVPTTRLPKLRQRGR